MSTVQPESGSDGILSGRTAVITGASRGIGKTVAKLFADCGADLAIVGRSKSSLELVLQEIHRPGGKVLPVTCDVTDPAQVQRMAEEVGTQLGPVHILVNNAGESGSHKFIQHSDELWHRMLAMNLTSVYYVSKAFVPAMVEKKWGRIINIASVASRLGSSYLSAYTASKHGVLGLTRALAAELLPFDITVNAVCPGYVDTPMTQGNISRIAERTGRTEEQVRAAIVSTTPQRRLVTPEEVAAMALFLTRDASRPITGQALNLDGGMGTFY